MAGLASTSKLNQVGTARSINPHTGGSPPNWVAQQAVHFAGEPVQTGGVVMLDGPGREKAQRRKLQAGRRIKVKLIAAIVPKPLLVTGWALPDEHGETESERNGGAQSIHLAVPAGAVYYFEADPDKDGGPGNAIALANALNWHGDPHAPDLGNTIKNRRSTLLGEKGYGLGVCGTWRLYEDALGAKP
jgi:hypothetical protein